MNIPSVCPYCWKLDTDQVLKHGDQVEPRPCDFCLDRLAEELCEPEQIELREEFELLFE